VYGLGFRVWGIGYRVYGLGIRDSTDAFVAALVAQVFIWRIHPNQVSS
jgi:hypothetical protein